MKRINPAWLILVLCFSQTMCKHRRPRPATPKSTTQADPPSSAGLTEVRDPLNSFVAVTRFVPIDKGLNLANLDELQIALAVDAFTEEAQFDDPNEVIKAANQAAQENKANPKSIAPSPPSSEPMMEVGYGIMGFESGEYGVVRWLRPLNGEAQNAGLQLADGEANVFSVVDSTSEDFKKRVTAALETLIAQDEGVKTHGGVKPGKAASALVDHIWTRVPEILQDVGLLVDGIASPKSVWQDELDKAFTKDGPIRELALRVVTREYASENDLKAIRAFWSEVIDAVVVAEFGSKKQFMAEVIDPAFKGALMELIPERFIPKSLSEKKYNFFRDRMLARLAPDGSGPSLGKRLITKAVSEEKLAKAASGSLKAIEEALIDRLAGFSARVAPEWVGATGDEVLENIKELLQERWKEAQARLEDLEKKGTLTLDEQAERTELQSRPKTIDAYLESVRTKAGNVVAARMKGGAGTPVPQKPLSPRSSVRMQSPRPPPSPRGSVRLPTPPAPTEGHTKPRGRI